MKDASTRDLFPLFWTAAKELVRRSDPDTSKEAAEKVDTARLEQMVYETIKKRPSTSEEVANVLNIPLQSITPRFAPLKRKGFICDTGEKRPGASGRSRVVFAVLNENTDQKGTQ